jgi:VWFA-related protein
MDCRLRRILFFVAVLLLCLAVNVRSSAQSTVAPQANAPAAASPATAGPTQMSSTVIHSETRLVLVDTVVTDKKGNYVRDLTQKDFKVFEDNKEQPVVSFSAGTDTTQQANSQRRYLILFFDNSTMDAPDQIQARGAASKFIDATAGPDHLMAVVEFGGALRIAQNFTADAAHLHAAVSGVKGSAVDPNADTQPVTIASTGISSLSTAEADFGARSMLLAVRSLAKNLRSVPGRKMLILFSGGFPLTTQNESELTATIDACNKANVAIYALDARGLVVTAPGANVSERIQPAVPLNASIAKASDLGAVVASAVPSDVAMRNAGTRCAIEIGCQDGTQPRPSGRSLQKQETAANEGRPRLVLASFPAPLTGDPQRPGGGGGGGRPGGGGGTGGTGGGTGGHGGTGGGNGGTGGKGGTPSSGSNSPQNYNNSPYSAPRTIVPPMLPSASTNQQILAALAEGTGGFTIFNTNDLLGGLQRIGNEQSEFYILGYTPPETPVGSCHTLKVKIGRTGTNVRSRSGYCNENVVNPLEGKPLEKQLEARATGAQSGSIHGALQAPYFYTAPNIARVNLAMEIPSDTLQFNKDKGKYHANINILGIAYKPDGSIGARFSDTVNLDFEKDDWKAFTQIPYHYENQFDAAPGTYKLTIVLSAGGDAFGKFESPLQIEPFDGKRLALSGLALTNSMLAIGQISNGLDSVLLEDHTPLVVKGMQIIPSGSNRFKKTDNVVLYTEVYEPLLTSEKPPAVGFGYEIDDQATGKKVFSTGTIRADDFIQKGTPVVPVGLKVPVKDLPVGAYRLIMQAVDAAGNHTPTRGIVFDLGE